MRNTASDNDVQYELISGIRKNNGENGIQKDAGESFTTYLKKPWNANQRLVQPNILIESSFDIETVMQFDETLLDETSENYAAAKQKLLDVFLEEYTLGTGYRNIFGMFARFL